MEVFVEQPLAFPGSAKHTKSDTIFLDTTLLQKFITMAWLYSTKIRAFLFKKKKEKKKKKIMLIQNKQTMSPN